MADSQTGAAEKLYTLTEISQKTGISMPTLQRYKKMYQGRIPSVGKGRSQRYPESSLAVFHELKQENIGRRGRPRKNAAAARPARPAGRRGPGRPPKAAAAAPAAESKSGLLTLTQIGEVTGISYPTLLRYVKSHGDRIPTVGRGRGRRYKPEAVDIFRDIRSKSRRGRKSAAAAAPAKAAPAKRGRKPGRPAAAKPAKAAAAKRGRKPRKAAAVAAAVDSGLGDRVKGLEKRLKGLEKLLGRVKGSWSR